MIFQNSGKSRSYLCGHPDNKLQCNLVPSPRIPESWFLYIWHDTNVSSFKWKHKQPLILQDTLLWIDILYRLVARSKLNLDVSLGLQRKPIKIVEGIKKKKHTSCMCAHIILSLLEFFSMWKTQSWEYTMPSISWENKSKKKLYSWPHYSGTWELREWKSSLFLWSPSWLYIYFKINIRCSNIYIKAVFSGII